MLLCLPVTAQAKARHAHRYKAKVVSAATCTKKGRVRYTCRCGKKYTRTVAAAKGHSRVTSKKNIVAATCGTDGGYDLVTTCRRCGKTLRTRNVAIPATGEHSYELVSSDGETAVFCCSICGQESTAAVSIEPYEVPATCTEDGVDAVITTYTLEDGEAIQSGASRAVPATGHDYRKVSKVSSDGTAVFRCSNCGQECLAEASVEHYVTEPTCTESGREITKTSYTLEDGESMCASSCRLIPATGHDYRLENGLFEFTGNNTAVFYCATCGEPCNATVAVTNSETPATCTKNGLEESWSIYTLENGKTFDMGACALIPATGHVYEKSVSSSGNSSTELYTCTSCGDWYTVTVTAPEGPEEILCDPIAVEDPTSTEADPNEADMADGTADSTEAGAAAETAETSGTVEETEKEAEATAPAEETAEAAAETETVEETAAEETAVEEVVVCGTTDVFSDGE